MSVGLSLLLTLVATANPYLAEGRKLHEALRFQEAIGPLSLAVKVPTNTVAERRLAHHLLARCHAALGRVDEAELTYVALLQSDAGAPEPDDAPPKLVQAYLSAKRRLYPPDFVRLSMRLAEGPMIVAEVRDPWNRAAKIVAVAPTRQELVLVLNEGTASGRVPSELSEATGQWMVVARNAAGAELARVLFSRRSVPVALRNLSGSEGDEVEVVYGTPVPPAVAWARWGTLGAAVAASAMSVGLALSSRSDSSAAGGAAFASETEALDRRARDKALAANWLGGVALGLGATSAVLFLAW